MIRRLCQVCAALFVFQAFPQAQAVPETGVITGRVVDEAGRPVPWARVTPVTRSKYWNGPFYETLVNTSDETDDRGVFRLHALPPGNYFVAVSYSSREFFDAAGPVSGYLRTYYPSTAALGAAQSVEVRAGAEASVTIRLQPIPFVPVSGRVVDSSGEPVARVDITLRGHPNASGDESVWPLEVRMPTVAGSVSAQDGTFTLRRVPPGRYVLSAMDRTKRREAGDPIELVEMPITVDGTAVLDIAVTLHPAATVRGRVEVKDLGPPGGLAFGHIRLNPVGRGSDYGGLDTQVNRDGTFEFRGLYGLRGIQSMGGPLFWAIDSLSGDSGVRDRWFLDVKPGRNVTDLRIVVTNRVSHLWATVVDEAGAAFKSGSVIVMPVSPTALDTRAWGFYHATQQNYGFNGVSYYQIESVIPGPYLVAAIDVEPYRLTGDTALMERARAGATMVDLREGRNDLALKVVRLKPFVPNPVVITRP